MSNVVPLRSRQERERDRFVSTVISAAIQAIAETRRDITRHELGEMIWICGTAMQEFGQKMRDDRDGPVWQEGFLTHET